MNRVPQLVTYPLSPDGILYLCIALPPGSMSQLGKLFPRLGHHILLYTLLLFFTSLILLLLLKHMSSCIIILCVIVKIPNGYRYTIYYDHIYYAAAYLLANIINEDVQLQPYMSLLYYCTLLHILHHIHHVNSTQVRVFSISHLLPDVSS